MIAGRTFEEQRLGPVERALQTCGLKLGGDPAEARFQLLEAAASRLGGFDVQAYQNAFEVRGLTTPPRLAEIARPIVEAIEACGIPPALALSALARERLLGSRQRTEGAYHTDYRLAMRLATGVKDRLVPGALVVDPACGAGMLLAAVSIIACGPDRMLAADWLAESVHAADLSAAALRGTLLSLASLTSDLAALRRMRSKWRVQDSLMASKEAWAAYAPKGFDLVVGNPPWEKVKLSRHEFVRGQGGKRHYGQTFGVTDLDGYDETRRATSDRSASLAARYTALGQGEPDLYVAFAELMLGLTKPGGVGSLLVPGGVIRSQGTEALRRHLIGSSASLDIAILDNKPRFFGIDTRFKFLSVLYRKKARANAKSASIRLTHGKFLEDKFQNETEVKIPLDVLTEVRPDLTLPEVRDASEWAIFLKAQRSGIDVSDPASDWFPRFCREIDMTHARSLFERAPTKTSLAVVEGRMIQPHRFGAKSYLCGEGRAAIWTMSPPGRSRLKPQFWMEEAHLSPAARDRSMRLRAGFCDITGQTNERTMMASLVPPGVICGNKVPTVLFPNDPSEERLYLWTAIVNSLPFDWLMRRVVTTTINYFLLQSIRIPPIAPDSLPGRRLVEIATRLRDLDKSASSFAGLWTIARLRAEADVIVGRAYGMDYADILKITADFPLLDRGQPAIEGERMSTVTRDLVMSTLCGDRHAEGARWADRVQASYRAGAAPYLPSEIASQSKELSDAK